ncbi:nuclease-related domain-containing protein [Frondihabitans australicus]|uniref:Nuclease-like protein n=1 Tax=Frondihabitans australicus TaxID=386892 RepID=A0A495IEU5_9MICO|nr:nuclease-related domain-containing protein [Frondihabitans australicus]RKR74512.1 nuclease-like protein [Frondihabitans australicus]
MTISAPDDDAAQVLTHPGSGAAAISAVEALWDRQAPVAPRTRASRILGRSPLGDSARAWFAPALGEARTAELLRTLSTSGEPWRVLHAIPVVAGAPAIDHLVIGPAGVFALSTATRDESGSETHVREPLVEARLASTLLSNALGRPAVVRAITVVVEPGRRPAEIPGVDVVGLDRLVRHLRSLVPVQSVEEVREITRVALKPRTWRAPGETAVFSSSAPGAGSHAHPTASELGFWFARLRTEVARARRVRLAWVTGLSGTVAAAAVIAPMVVQQLSS